MAAERFRPQVLSVVLNALSALGQVSLAMIQLALLPLTGFLFGWKRCRESLWDCLSQPLIHYGLLYSPVAFKPLTVLVANGSGYTVLPAALYPMPPAPLERWAMKLKMRPLTTDANAAEQGGTAGAQAPSKGPLKPARS